MASTNTLPVPKFTYLGWQSGFDFFMHSSTFGSVPRVLILHPRDLGLVPFFPIFGRFHVLDPSSNPSFLRSTVPLALLLSVFLQLGASSLHSAARVMSPLVSSFSCPTSSFSNPTVFPFEPVCTVGETGGLSSVVVDDGSEREASLSRPGGSAALVV